jgi:hypothetical protein
VVVFTGRVAVQWARENNDGRRMMRVAVGTTKAALCGVGCWEGTPGIGFLV